VAAERKTVLSSDLTSEQRAVAADVLAGKNVFLTGAAGTGKSFLFAYLVQQLTAKHGEDTVAVTAPTGIAAINVNGVTIHSFSGVGR
jgi:ATP-dependent DNA helicase PIF1